MPLSARIDATDREFFELVAQTAFCNPFSEQRAELDLKLIGHSVEPFSETHQLELSRAVSTRLRALEARGLADMRTHSARDRDLLQTVILFEIFHQFAHQLDELILEQIKLGARSAPVKFGGELLARMRSRGIGHEESVRFFSIFYQLRRAYHFIVRGLVGQSASMKELRRRLWNNVFTEQVRLYERHLWERMEDFSTLLLGETGSGKGAAAAAIGRSGFIPFQEKQERFAESFMRGFVALNLSQFPESLIESELFGHRKGAFTGAVEAHEGVLARCSAHGAIFLDEIGEVGAAVQIKLLQVLQERTFCPVGSHEPLRFRGRVIAATNRPLDSLRVGGLFRDDFYYRLCSDVVAVPPLRQRLEEEPKELPELVEHLLSNILAAKPAELLRRVQAALLDGVGLNYPWPGNVRELEQAIRRILLTGSYAGALYRRSIGPREKLLAAIETQNLSAEELLAAYCGLLYARCGTYEAVAEATRLDWRTVKKYIGGDSSNR